MKKTVLRKYAQLIAKVGINVQKGQEVIITAELDQPEFIRILVEECYKAGASKVKVDWSDTSITKTHIKYQSLKTLSTIEKWEEERLQHGVDVLPCRIYIESEDPDGLKGVDQTKMQKSRQAKYPIIKKYRDQLDNKYQ
ncbi:MAG: aminopeptidase [Sphaerochaetaceae bacterium]|nr:aminopeptidase [Sphaerochaetaceae bacterium]